MGTIGKVITIASLLYAGYRAYDYVTNQAGFKVKGYGIPEFRSWNEIILPVKIQFNNPTPAKIDVDRLVVNVFVWLHNQWLNVASIDRPVTLLPGKHMIEIKPTLRLSSLFTDIIGSALSISSTKKIFTRTEVTATFHGIEFPTQSYEENIDL